MHNVYVDVSVCLVFFNKKLKKTGNKSNSKKKVENIIVPAITKYRKTAHMGVPL